jgi:hypothetical protein
MNPDNQDPNPFYCINRAGMDNSTVQSVKNVVNQRSINTGNFTHIYWHGVRSWTLPEDSLRVILDWLRIREDQGDVWVAAYMNAIKYMTERIASTIQIISSTADEIKLSLSIQNPTASVHSFYKNLDNAIYDYPLTLEVEVPSSWADQTIYMDHDNSSAQHSTYNRSGTTFVMINAAPDKGDIRLGTTAQTTSINKVFYESSNLNLHISPNPVTANGKIYFHIPDYYTGSREIRVLDMKGRVVNTVNLGSRTYGHVPLTFPKIKSIGFASGSYVVALYAGNRRTSRRVVVLR